MLITFFFFSFAGKITFLTGGNFLPRWHWSPKLGMKIGFTWFRNKAIKIFFQAFSRTYLKSLFFFQTFFSSNWCSFKTDVFQRTKKKVWKEEEEPERKSRCSATCLCALLPRKGRKRPLLKKRKKYIALLSAKLWLSEEPDAPLHKKDRNVWMVDVLTQLNDKSPFDHIFYLQSPSSKLGWGK